MMAYVWKRSNDVHGKYEDSLSGALLVIVPISFGLILLITNFMLIVIGVSAITIILGIHLREWNITVIGLSILSVVIHPPLILLVLLIHGAVKFKSKKEVNK